MVSCWRYARLLIGLEAEGSTWISWAGGVTNIILCFFFSLGKRWSTVDSSFSQFEPKNRSCSHLLDVLSGEY